MRYIQILSNSGEVQTALDSRELGKPYLAYLEDEHRIDWNSQEIPEPVYSVMPLTFEIISGGTINWKPSDSSAITKSIQYKVNEGEWEWTQSADSATTTINVNAGDKVQIRGFDSGYTNADATGQHSWSFCGSTAVFEAYGNIMSLINNDLTGTIMDYFALYSLFKGCTGLTSAENLILPATTLAEGCYWAMFRGCTSLTTAPELPATTLANYCYTGMFNGCTSLTTAPALPATTLTKSCYNQMFRNCTNLIYIKCLATDISASNCTTDWMYHVSASGGTFVKNPNMSSWTTGPDGIPTNWTVQDAVI